MVLQHSLVGKSLHWHIITIILLNAKEGIFPPSYDVIPSFISTFYCLDPCFILYNFYVIGHSYTCVTVLLVY